MMKRSDKLQFLFRNIDTLKAKMDQFRPFSASLEQALQERLRIEWTYNSNALEGNTLTFGETAFFLRQGLTSEGRPLKDYLEAKNHAEAIDTLHDILKNRRQLTESLIKELHHLLMKDVGFTQARGLGGQMIKKILRPGQYKQEPNHVLTLSGKIHRYTDPLHVKDEMESLIDWYSGSQHLHSAEQAALFHYKFVAIHPFDDGNGRMARILMNLILLKRGYPPCIIQNNHRKEYLQSLATADSQKKMTPFILFVGNELLGTLTTILNILTEQTQVLSPGDTELVNRSEREQHILQSFSDQVLSIQQLHKKLPQIKRPTLKSDLKRLVKEKRLKTSGAGRGVVYQVGKRG